MSDPSVLEVVHRTDDGMIVRSLAFYSYRGPIGQWMLGDNPLRELKDEIIYKGPRLSDDEFADRLRKAEKRK